jgi:hypothetical protein
LKAGTLRLPEASPLDEGMFESAQHLNVGEFRSLKIEADQVTPPGSKLEVSYRVMAKNNEWSEWKKTLLGQMNAVPAGGFGWQYRLIFRIDKFSPSPEVRSVTVTIDRP